MIYIVDSGILYSGSSSLLPCFRQTPTGWIYCHRCLSTYESKKQLQTTVNNVCYLQSSSQYVIVANLALNAVRGKVTKATGTW